MTKERIQKILAQNGIGSRRICEKFIVDGRVMLNDKVATIGSKADPEIDNIMFDGRPIINKKERIYIALNKPVGILSTTRSNDGRSTVVDLIGHRERLYPVGRLDINSEGLMLITNDGDLTYKLTHPKFLYEKEYRVLVAHHPEKKQLLNWQKGILLKDGRKTASTKVWVESHSGERTWLRLILHEGRKRQIRETGGLLGLPVLKIIRVRIGTLHLGNLHPGEWRYLNYREIMQLTKGKK